MPACGVSGDLFSCLGYHPLTVGRHTLHSTNFTESSAANDSATETCERSVCACKEGYHCIHKDKDTGHYFFGCKVEADEPGKPVKPDRIDGYDKVSSECSDGNCICVHKTDPNMTISVKNGVETIEMSVNGSNAVIEPSYELREFPAFPAKKAEGGHEDDRLIPTTKLYRRTEWIEHFKNHKDDFQAYLDEMHMKMKKSVEAAESKGNEPGSASGEDDGAKGQADKVVDGHADGSTGGSASSGKDSAKGETEAVKSSSASADGGDAEDANGTTDTVKDAGSSGGSASAEDVVEKSSDEIAAGAQSSDADQESAEANDDSPNQDEAKQLEGLALLGSTLLNRFSMTQKNCVHMQNIAQKLCSKEDNCGDAVNCYEDAHEQDVADKFTQLIILSENMASQNISSFLQVFPRDGLHHDCNFTHSGRRHATGFGIMSSMTGGDATLKQRGWSGLKGGLMAGVGSGAICKLRGGNECLGNAAKSAAVGGATAAVTNRPLAGGAVGVGFGALTHKGIDLPLLALQPCNKKRYSDTNRMSTFRNFLVAT